MSQKTLKWLNHFKPISKNELEEEFQNGYLLCTILQQTLHKENHLENELDIGDAPDLVQRNYNMARKWMRQLGMVLSKKEERDISSKVKGAGLTVAEQIRKRFLQKGLAKRDTKNTFEGQLQKRMGLTNSNLIVEKKLQKFYRREEQNRERYYRALELQKKNRRRTLKDNWVKSRKSRNLLRASKIHAEKNMIKRHTMMKIDLDLKLGKIERQKKLLEQKLEEENLIKRQLQRDQILR